MRNFRLDFLPLIVILPYHASAMAKIKSHSGAKKRVRRTGSGRIVMKRNSRNHLLMQKSRRQRKLPRAFEPVNLQEQKTLMRLLPHL